MSAQKPTVVLVHGAFAESASWNDVIAQLHESSLDVVAAANPLRSLTGDAAYLRDVVAGIGTPVVLVGHSYGGMVITEAAGDNAAVTGLVYVGAFAPESGESALQLSGQFPGSSLGEALVSYPVADGDEVAIRPELFQHQFAADVPAERATLMAVTQRPVTQAALAAGLPTVDPAWKSKPSWFVFGADDLNIPVAAHRFMAQRAGAKEVVELAGGSHALSVSHPEEVTHLILSAVEASAPVAASS